MQEQIFTNAMIVLADQVVHGSMVVADGSIREIGDARSRLSQAVDLAGDYLMPGLVDLHTDNIEKHLTPRPMTHWPADAAIVGHDAQMVAAGITTVLDAVSIGDIAEDSARIQRLGEMVAGLAHAGERGLVKAAHLLHLRCEICFPTMKERLDELCDHPLVRMFSIMDHTPGERQFASLAACHTFYRQKYGFDEEQMRAFIATSHANQERYADEHRRHVIAVAKARQRTLASHDDSTQMHIQQACEAGAGIAEFPTTLAAANAAVGAGLYVMVGGPNLVRGQSHSGNVSACELAASGFLDIICSDYVPYSMLHAAFLLAETLEGWDLPQAVRTVTQHPAESVGLLDRGILAQGKRADLIRVASAHGLPIVRGVWRGGRRVA